MVGQVTRQGKAVELICDTLRLYLSLSLKVSSENLLHSLNLMRLWTKSYDVSYNSNEPSSIQQYFKVEQ